MIERDLFIVTTPLQLINAIEANNCYQCSNSTLVIITSAAYDKNVFSPLLEIYRWQEIHYFDLKEKLYRTDLPTNPKPAIVERPHEVLKELGQAIRKYRWEFLLNKFNRVNRLVIGNYSYDVINHSISVISYNFLVLLDDGTDTIKISKNRSGKKQEEFLEKKDSLIKSLKRHIRHEYVDWRISEVGSLEFFTCYDININVHRDTLSRNTYSYLKQKRRNQSVREEVFFLGQTLVETGYLPMEKFLLYLRAVVEYFNHTNFTYIPHPRESADVLKKIECELHIQIHKFDRPIEVELILRDYRPTKIASFFSSALENIQLIFEDSIDITFFEVNSADLMHGCEFVQDFYEYFRSKQKNGFEVVPLDLFQQK